MDKPTYSGRRNLFAKITRPFTFKQRQPQTTVNSRWQRALSTGALSVILSFTLSPATQAKEITYLYQSDFADGTVQITEPGTYRLAEDISFNPHPVGSLDDHGNTLEAYNAGLPFYSQYGPTELGKYDPAAFGIGFFAAIAISANNVVLDLNDHRIEQSAEHALLQRFFSVIELADQPFIPAQGPADFGNELIPAKNVRIINGTIGRSSHHGIHGNDNKNVVIRNVDFEDFEVAAVALNGVNGLTIKHSHATNRKDVPIIGTFSNARFIAAYVDWLVMTGSTTTLNVQGVELTAAQIQQALRTSINNVYEDVITDGEGFINPIEHPDDYALYHNKHGIVDGNAYGYLVNPLGVAVLGFPEWSSTAPAKNVKFVDVHIDSQHAFINEVIALEQSGKPAIDPVGAVFMVRNTHPDTGAPVTTSSLDESVATYIGNPLANAQALVAKATWQGEYDNSPLDVSRLNITPAILEWIENQTTLDTVVSGPESYLCNGDTMFHVNKGVIGFKMDGAKGVTLRNTSANDIANFGEAGSEVCGNYAVSHPDATLAGYGGAKVRGYSFAGSRQIRVTDAQASTLMASAGTVIGFDILTDTRNVLLKRATVEDVEAGLGFVANGGPNDAPDAIGVQIGADARKVTLKHLNVSDMQAFDDEIEVAHSSN